MNVPNFTYRQVNPETGLYALPVGYYWKVKRWYGSFYPLIVKLKRKHTFWFDTTVGSEISTADPTDLLHSASHAMQDSYSKEQKRRKLDRIKSYVGTYPPKKIGA